MSEFSEQIAEIDKTINKELFKRYFRYQDLIGMKKELYKARNTERNKIQANFIKSSLKKPENNIKRMPKMRLKFKSQMK